MNKLPESEFQSCEICKVGRRRLVTVPFIELIDGQIMVIPNTPAYSCDVCGHMEYDANYMRNVDYLLDSPAQTNQIKRPSDRSSISRDPISGWQPTSK